MKLRPSASGSANERTESGADIESCQRSEAHRPCAVGLLVECMPHAMLTQRASMPIRAFVSARPKEGRVEAIPAVINRPDSHPVWHRPSRSGQARTIVAHDLRIDEPPRVLEQITAEGAGSRPAGRAALPHCRPAGEAKTVPIWYPEIVLRPLRPTQKVLISRLFLRSGRQDLNLRPPGPQPEGWGRGSG